MLYEITSWCIPIGVGIVSLVLALALPREQIAWSGWAYFSMVQFCDGVILTYNVADKHTGGVTYGGYSTSIVVDQDFVLRIPDKLDLAAAAPLLRAAEERNQILSSVFYRR